MTTADMTPDEYRKKCEDLARRLGTREHDNHPDLARGELETIAMTLADKCVRGNRACIACGAIAYMGGVEHNEGCAVVKLKAMLGDS